MAARIDRVSVKLLTRSGLEWTAKYPATAAAVAKLKVRMAYLDGELCGVRPDEVTSFELMQQASDGGGSRLVYFAFDLLELDGEDIAEHGPMSRSVNSRPGVSPAFRLPS
jgi:bifunctional non-homologous end joining protein LigD